MEFNEEAEKQKLRVLKQALDNEFMNASQCSKKQKEILDRCCSSANTQPEIQRCLSFLVDILEENLIAKKKWEKYVNLLKNKQEQSDKTQLIAARPMAVDEANKAEVLEDDNIELSVEDCANCLALSSVVYNPHPEDKLSSYRHTIDRMIYANISSQKFIIAEKTNEKEKVLYTAFRGTDDLSDILTDISAFAAYSWQGKFHHGKLN